MQLVIKREISQLHQISKNEPLDIRTVFECQRHLFNEDSRRTLPTRRKKEYCSLDLYIKYLYIFSQIR